MSTFICRHMSKQSRGMKVSTAKSASAASLRTGQFQMTIAASEGGAGTTPTGGECSSGCCWEIHTLPPFWQSSRQQLTGIVRLAYLANPYKGEGRSMYPGVQGSSHFGRDLLAPALVPLATWSYTGLLSSL